MPTDYVIEPVIADAMLVSKALTVHHPELVPTNTGGSSPNFLDELHYEGFTRKRFQQAVIMLVIGLSAHTKQLTEGCNPVEFAIPAVKPACYLVPAFFRSMPYTSLPKATISS